MDWRPPTTPSAVLDAAGKAVVRDAVSWRHGGLVGFMGFYGFGFRALGV